MMILGRPLAAGPSDGILDGMWFGPILRYHHGAHGNAELEAAAALSGFAFNPDKTQPPGNQVFSFNIAFGSGMMEVVEDRMAEFEIAIRNGSAYEIGGILGYVGSVNTDQGDRLADMLV